MVIRFNSMSIIQSIPYQVSSDQYHYDYRITIDYDKIENETDFQMVFSSCIEMTCP